MCPGSISVNLAHSQAHLPSSIRHLPAESHSLQRPLSSGRLVGSWLLISTLHTAVSPQTNDSPSLGLGYFLFQRSGLGRFLCRYDTLQIVSQSEIGYNVSLHCSLPNQFTLTVNSRYEGHHTSGLNLSLYLGKSELNIKTSWVC